MLERAAQELAPFLGEVAFVGGATVALWITDQAAPEPRITKPRSTDSPHLIQTIRPLPS